MLFLFLIVCGVIAIIVVKVNSAVYFVQQNLERRKVPKVYSNLVSFAITSDVNFQIVNPNNKDIRDIPGLAPPVPARRLLYLRTPEHFE